MAASLPISSQLGAIAVRRMSAASSNSNDTASQRAKRRRTPSLASSGVAGRTKNTSRASPVASNAATALDLLRKSDLNGNAVAKGGNEVGPKVKPAPSVAIRLLENAEDFEPPLGYALRGVVPAPVGGCRPAGRR